MEVSSVSSSAYQPAQVQRPEQSQQTQQAAPEKDVAREQEARKSPVVNLQGQTTGQVINTSA